MRVLALDTTSPPGSLALWEQGSVLSHGPVQDGRPFGECLPGVVLDALAAAGWHLRDVDAFVVGRGPGSLTGLRVGIATVQGFAFANQRPLVGVSALEALAHSVAMEHAQSAPRLVAASMDARRDEVFAELFEESGGVVRSLTGPTVGAPDAIASRWSRYAGGDLWVIGNAAHATVTAWERSGRPIARVLDAPSLAGVMAVLGARAVEQGRATPPHAVSPLYVRRPDAEVARDRRRAATAETAGPGSTR